MICYNVKWPDQELARIDATCVGIGSNSEVLDSELDWNESHWELARTRLRWTQLQPCISTYSDTTAPTLCMQTRDL